jgi:hypothetical protein
MNQFIYTNTSLINKNNSITIKLGKKIEDTIFDYKLSKNTIDLFLKNCIHNSIHFSKVSTVHIYKYLNNAIEINNKKHNYYSYKTLDYLIIGNNSNDMLLTLNSCIKNDSNIVSVYNYNSITLKEEYLSTINNLFTICINNYIEYDNNNTVKNKDSNYYTISIIIKKPSNYNKLITKLEEIINLIPTTLK